MNAVIEKKWQPLEMAPKVNGKQILVMSKDGQQCSVSQWCSIGKEWDFQSSIPDTPYVWWMPLPALQVAE